MEKFKKGDKVFDILYGWGCITIIDDSIHPICVVFDIGAVCRYDKNGAITGLAKQTLSFTGYTLEGFSQERPEVLPEKGDVVWVRDSEDSKWKITHFIEKVGNDFHASDFASGIKYLATWKYMTTVNPYKNGK